MNIVELVMMVCSLSNPNARTDKRPDTELKSSLKSCMMPAQPYLAQWANEHPNDRIAAYHCAWPDQEGKDL